MDSELKQLKEKSFTEEVLFEDTWVFQDRKCCMCQMGKPE